MRFILIPLFVACVLYTPKIYKFLKENVKKIPKPEIQLDNLLKTGIALNPVIDNKDILLLHDRIDYNRQPYGLIYSSLGDETENGTFISDNCWRFDAECIEDQGAYADIITNLGRISNGELKFKNIKDFVDVENEIAWVSFEIKGDSYKWDLKVDNDWADGSLFDHIQALTKKYKTKGKFTMHSLGQDGVIGYMTTAQRKEFNLVTNLDVQWLKGKMISG